jgi:peptidoglycan/xylan/chitin deacetylase (PgdA/CDA1 family)
MGWAVRLVAAWRRDIVLAGPGAGRRVALTLDDGPDPVVTPRVLDVLARHGARATFFVIGERARADFVERIPAGGHEGNHGWREPQLHEQACDVGFTVVSETTSSAGRPA